MLYDDEVCFDAGAGYFLYVMLLLLLRSISTLDQPSPKGVYKHSHLVLVCCHKLLILLSHFIESLPDTIYYTRQSVGPVRAIRKTHP